MNKRDKIALKKKDKKQKELIKRLRTIKSKIKMQLNQLKRDKNKLKKRINK